MREKEFRERIARIQRIQKLNEKFKQYSKEENLEKNNLLEVMPVIGGIKKNIENFRNSTKEIIIEER